MSAKVVFATAIGYLKDHLVGEIKHRKLGAVEDMMYWVVSVPAIWNDSCKQFMRESAEVVLFYIIFFFFKSHDIMTTQSKHLRFRVSCDIK